MASQASPSQIQNDNPLSPGPHSFSAHGLTITYIVAGSGPILIAQAAGWGPGSSYMVNGWQAFEAHHTVIYCTPRGSAPSSRPSDDSEMSSLTMSDDLEQLRLHLGVPKVSLIGHSNGGCIILYYAQRYSANVEKLVLIDHELMGGPDRESMQKFMDERKDNPVYSDALKVFLGIITGQLRPHTDEEFKDVLAKLLPYYFGDTTKVPVLLEAMTGPVSVYALRQGPADNGAPSQIEDLAKVTAKTLIFTGSEDPICPVSIGKRTYEGIKDSEWIVYEGSGHFPWIEEPERFAADVNRFLTS
jgi:proline iminopeptidase